MNYIDIYDKLINRAKNRTIAGYRECHHILPKSMGGTNDKDKIKQGLTWDHLSINTREDQ